MSPLPGPIAPPFCPNPRCVFHRDPRGWRFARKGFFVRGAAPHRIQRYRCSHCRRSFSSQTFATSYWLRRPDLSRVIFLRVLACSAYRQIARELAVSPTTVLRQVARLGRHCLLFHERLRPKTAPAEPLVVDGFESFEFSQYTPVHFHLAVGAASHFVYGFTDSELRRKGRMNEAQRERRRFLEARFGRPDPRSIEREMAALLAIVVPPRSGGVEVRSDEHPAYPRALRLLPERTFRHAVTSARRRRTVFNPLFPVNLADLLIRHSSANHKRETIAFSKRRQSAAERLAVLLVWRNAMKSFSEKRRDASPAQRLGLLERRLGVDDVLAARLFPSRIALPARWSDYYWRNVTTRRIPNGARHQAVYAV
jgi:transposase-like protein